MQRRSYTHPAQLLSVGSRSQVASATSYLQENDRIGASHDRPCLYPRYVDLHCQSIFNSLVKLYEGFFLRYDPYLQNLVKGFALENTGCQSHTEYAAKVYVSAWFIDLYVSNREAIRNLNNSVYNDLLRGEEQVHVLEMYDAFLSALNAVIRPTHIKLSTEDTIYIPIISARPDWSSSNPFGITGFLKNVSLLQCLMDMIEMKGFWKLESLESHILGRPMWLLDWHDHQAYTWFPMEENFDNDDVSLAYILGIACTPLLGHRDTDDWQVFPANGVPENISEMRCERVMPQQFFGTCEVRKIEKGTQQWPLPPDFGAKYGLFDPLNEPVKEEVPSSSKRLRTKCSFGDASTDRECHGASNGGVKTEEAGLTSSGRGAPQRQGESESQAQLVTFHCFRIVDYVYNRCVIQKWDEYSQSIALNSLLERY